MSRKNWESVIGLGVAGNFAGHLEQAGEANDFKDLVTEDARAPKGIFPFYVPGSGSHPLHQYPISSDTLRLGSPNEKHQIEPELALLCELIYENDRVVNVVPKEAMAHNDCSIRREQSEKISEKKNWGAESKGTANQSIMIDRFGKGGVLDGYRIASFLERGNDIVDYGVDSAATSYSYMYGELIEWLIEKLNDQKDEGPLEDIANWLAVAGRPHEALISIGATRYTDFGETTFLEPGDRCIVAVYDAKQYDEAAVREIAGDDSISAIDGISLLRQNVV